MPNDSFSNLEMEIEFVNYKNLCTSFANNVICNYLSKNVACIYLEQSGALHQIRYHTHYLCHSQKIVSVHCNAEENHREKPCRPDGRAHYTTHCKHAKRQKSLNNSKLARSLSFAHLPGSLLKISPLPKQPNAACYHIIF